MAVVLLLVGVAVALVLCERISHPILDRFDSVLGFFIWLGASYLILLTVIIPFAIWGV